MNTKEKARKRRAALSRAKISKQGKHRIVVDRSNMHIGLQLISIDGKVLAQASTKEKALLSSLKNGGNVEAAKVVGDTMAKRIKETGISDYAFDRCGYKYHGRVQALADAMRKAGIKI